MPVHSSKNSVVTVPNAEKDQNVANVLNDLTARNAQPPLEGVKVWLLRLKE
jgi:hypothetical protein